MDCANRPAVSLARFDSASASSVIAHLLTVSHHADPASARARFKGIALGFPAGRAASPLAKFRSRFSAPDPNVADDDGKRRFARASYVFNAAQVDGYAAPDAPDPLGPIERIEAADRFVAATGARIEHGGDQAYYVPSSDHIQMPDEGLFCGSDTMSREEGYYATLVHELTHWSGAKHRLDRDFGKRFGEEAYAAEELVAEIGAAFLCAELGITQEIRSDHAQYLAHWLKLLKNDSRAIFTAAAKASEAASYPKRIADAERRAA